MFLALFERRSFLEANVKKQANSIYANALEQTRKDVFFNQYGVPDTFSGRFDLLLLHIFLILNFMMKMKDGGKILSQALFDVMFLDMDQTLREMGVGDMGIPKHQRRMMKAFNGRMHAYKLALEIDGLDGTRVKEKSLGEVLKNNLYAENLSVTQNQVQNMISYVIANSNFLKIDKGMVIFVSP